jgi:hypothetical protein
MKLKLEQANVEYLKEVLYWHMGRHLAGGEDAVRDGKTECVQFHLEELGKAREALADLDCASDAAFLEELKAAAAQVGPAAAAPPAEDRKTRVSRGKARSR